PTPLVVRVVDAGGGAPVAGATVRVTTRAGESLSRTDVSGIAQVGGAAGGVVTIRALGFLPREVALDAPALDGAGTDTLRVRLTAAPLALDRMVVTAARREQRLADAIVTTEVVGRREIERSGATDLASVLTEQTGIQLHGGHPSGAGVMLQGIGAERVLVLLDGQPLVGRVAGNFDLSRIPTGMVERVEVVKGPQSTLYGSEAMGGVVNIVTRSAPEAGWGGSVTALGGSDGRRDALLSGAGSMGPWSAVVDGGLRTIERAPGRGDEAGALADRRDGSLKLRWAPDSAGWVEAAGLVVDERQRWQTGTLFDFADNRQTGARLSASRLMGEQRLTSTLHLSQFDHLARSSRTPAPIAGTGDAQVQRLAEAELLYTGRVAGLAVDAGVEAREEYIRSSDGRIRSEDGGTSRTLWSAEPFAQVELGGGAWSVVPGARLTWNEQWGSHLTPRLAARWRPVEGLTLRASAGRGFRAPDFKELYLQFTNENAGYAVYGNPDLRPEHSDNVTLGAEWSAGRLYARAQLFHNRLSDFIETRPLPSDGPFLMYEYANVEQGLTRGAELEGGLAVGSLRAEAAYGYLDAEDRATGLPLLGRPTHSARATLGGMLPFDVRASVTALYTGATPMERDGSGVVVGERDAFFRTDVRLARQLPGGLEIVAGADNLFDQRPARWEGAVGRHVYAALSWSFAQGGE
ncbi:MAG TPA: TonB-dependent receptor, partial [Gemmatimonadaceae bacterium]|nr:TonB-dependent receptor [Gemmatimonadaceae bacterium]